MKKNGEKEGFQEGQRPKRSTASKVIRLAANASDQTKKIRTVSTGVVIKKKRVSWTAYRKRATASLGAVSPGMPPGGRLRARWPCFD